MKTRLLALLDKEWSDALKNRYILYLLILLPLLFTALPIGMLIAVRYIPVGELSSQMGELPPGWQHMLWPDMKPEELMQVAMAGQFTLFFLLIPLAIPMTIATYSVIGEKRERSLEPLLATPLSTFELLLGKSLAAAAPGVAVTWICAILFAIAARPFAVSARVYGAIISPTWLLDCVLLAPLLTVLATTLGLMISSRANDPRSAEQLGMLIVLPVLGLFFGQMAGLIMMGPTLVLQLALVLVVIDFVLLRVGGRMFQRETILTRWK